VTLPAVRPALIAGAVLAWARALGEFGATITFAGNFPGRTQTMPLSVYLALVSNPGQALVLNGSAVQVQVVTHDEHHCPIRYSTSRVSSRH
jgi:molybdate transport system permease protein